nr:hypothetical protein [Cellulomonas sp. PSBB021]
MLDTSSRPPRSRHRAAHRTAHAATTSSPTTVLACCSTRATSIPANAGSRSASTRSTRNPSPCVNESHSTCVATPITRESSVHPARSASPARSSDPALPPSRVTSATSGARTTHHTASSTAAVGTATVSAPGQWCVVVALTNGSHQAPA